MTVNYHLDVSSSSPIVFLKLLSRWRGSIWKSVIWELIIWLIFYYSIHFIYVYDLMSTNTKNIFEEIAIHTSTHLKTIPLTWMLGFFVTSVFDRWKNVLNVLPFIESVALSVAVLIPGKSEIDRLYRRNIIRYVVLHQILILRDISMRVRRRFPTMKYLIDAGFLTEDEYETLNTVNCKPGSNYWVPINWANSLALDAHKQNMIEQPTAFNNVIFAIKEFRVAMETLTRFDQIPIPIAYPQVIFLAVRVYFLICLFSRQFLSQEKKLPAQMSIPFPIITILEFIFVMGWMKVAEVLLNPFGEDDDDFETNWIIDKNIKTGMAIVDDTHAYHPVVVNDQFSDPDYLPAYSTQSQWPRNLEGSASTVELAAPEEQVKIVRLNHEDIHSSKNGILFHKSQSLRHRTVSTSSSNIESSPGMERKFNLSMPATTSGFGRSFRTDRPVLETLDEEFEGGGRGNGGFSADSPCKEKQQSQFEDKRRHE